VTRRGRIGWLCVAALVAAACGGNEAASSASTAGSASAIATVPAQTSPASVAAPSVASTPAPTSVAAASGRIAFRRGVGESSSQVYLVDVDGSHEVQLTHEDGAVEDLHWAPDGSRLYFQNVKIKGCGESFCYPRHLISIRADGSDRVDLGQLGAWGVGAISPDRRYLAFPAGEGYPDDAGQSFQIEATLVDLLTGTMSSLETTASMVVWSPDGKRLLAAEAARMLVLDAHAPSTRLRIDDPWVEHDAPVGWSADGGSIFYHRCAPDLDKDEAMACHAGPSWIVDLDDPNLVPQPNAGPEPPRGELSPDGSWLAAFVDAELASGLYLTPAAGGDPVLVALLDLDSGAFEHPPSWSADGAWIAVGIPSGINVVPASGGEPLFVTHGEIPAWQPGNS
jgi:hypothetical protein